MSTNSGESIMADQKQDQKQDEKQYNMQALFILIAADNARISALLSNRFPDGVDMIVSCYLGTYSFQQVRRFNNYLYLLFHNKVIPDKLIHFNSIDINKIINISVTKIINFTKDLLYCYNDAEIGKITGSYPILGKPEEKLIQIRWERIRTFFRELTEHGVADIHGLETGPAMVMEICARAGIVIEEVSRYIDPNRHKEVHCFVDKDKIRDKSYVTFAIV